MKPLIKSFEPFPKSYWLNLSANPKIGMFQVCFVQQTSFFIFFLIEFSTNYSINVHMDSSSAQTFTKLFMGKRWLFRKIVQDWIEAESI